jgi:hypothetical protein
VRTTKSAGFSLAIQKPVAEPVLHAMILLSPMQLLRCVRAKEIPELGKGLAQGIRSFKEGNEVGRTPAAPEIDEKGRNLHFV